MSNLWHAFPVIDWHDLETRTDEIMDALEGGDSFTLVHHGRVIGTMATLAPAAADVHHLVRICTGPI